MRLRFDLEQVETVEFGIGLDHPGGESFRAIAVDGNVQDVLIEMTKNTWIAMRGIESRPAEYSPSEKYSSEERVFVPLTDNLARRLRRLHDAQNLRLDSSTLDNPSAIFCYFARMTDRQGRRLTGLRRASHFKGVLKKRLIRLVSDALKIIEDNVFKLDEDFDLLIDSNNVHILRPSGFEFAGRLQAAVLEAVPRNVAALQAELPFLHFDNIRDYAGRHVRAARYLASIRAQTTQNIDTTALRNLCRNTGVEVRTVSGKLRVDDGHIIGFLEVLDRRRYEVALVRNAPERFRAASRKRIE